jgi:hypothetical protein
MALKNKIFDAVQKSLAPVYANIEYHGTQRPIPDGAITIVTMPGHIDVSGPAKQRPYCSTDYRTNTLTGLNAQLALYHDEDSYGIRLLKPASKDELGASGGTNSKAFMQRYMSFADSITKLMGAKKISAEQASKALKDFSANANTAAPDVKKMEVEHNLRITVSLNPEDHELMLVKLGDKNNSVVQHAVKGASFEVFTGEIKDSDGDWIPNREVVYMGNFTTPVRGKSGGGFDAFVTDIQYPAKANKLSVYAITVRLEGGKEMLDKALSTIDFAALQALMTK